MTASQSGMFGDKRFSPRPIDQGSSWEKRALAAVVNFVCTQRRGREFLTEELVASVREDIGEPRNLQAWGPVMVKAAAAGIVTKNGLRLAANGRPATVWQRGPST